MTPIRDYRAHIERIPIMSRREWEAEQINKMLDEIIDEPLCNILSYAAEHLASRTDISRHDTRVASILTKYSDILATRIRESRS